MKKTLSLAFVVAIVFTSCGPAAEDRVQMDRLAKRMSDSLANLIDSSLNDPLKYVNFEQAPAQPVPVADTAKPVTPAGN